MEKKPILEIAEETAQAVKRIEEVTGKVVKSFRHCPALDSPNILDVQIVFDDGTPILVQE